MNSALSLAFFIYLVALVVIGLVAYRRTRTFDDFYLAGRKLNPWVTALSAEASSE
ncbi:MAG TPA: sodium:proline symporter, partial [Firmicutes bacterium]|nr:sodium:proline symporter [Bacillota bacterium]